MGVLMSHRRNRMDYHNRRPVKQRAAVGNLFEEVFYETKPFIMLGIAAVCARDYYATSPMAKLSIGILFTAAAYIIYRRLVYRGYLK